MSQKQLVEVVDKNGRYTRRWKKVDDRGSRALTGLSAFAPTLDAYKKRTDRYHNAGEYAERQRDAVDHESAESIKTALMTGEVVTMIHEGISSEYNVDVAFDFDGSQMALDPGRDGRSHPVTAWIDSDEEGIVYADQDKFSYSYTTAEGNERHSFFVPTTENGEACEDGVLSEDEYNALESGFNRVSEYDHYLTNESQVEDAAHYIWDMTFEDDEDD